MLKADSAPVRSSRIQPLDALRGIAVIWVFFYHFFHFWTPSGRGDPYLPYGDAFFWVPMSDVGYLGVRLFFIISGFVILLTLERTQSIQEFAIRRIARLYPTLILCGSITFAVVTMFGPEGLRTSIGEYFFSVLSLPPDKVGAVFGISDWGWLDGSYWSLWVEIRFYILIGLLYFFFRKNWLNLWLVLQGFCLIAYIAFWVTKSDAIDTIGGLLFYEYIPLFTIGILSYKNFVSSTPLKRGNLLIGLSVLHSVIISILALQASTSNGETSLQYLISYTLGYGLLFGLFFGAIHSQSVQRLLSFKPLVSLGRSSYSFYLLHQVIGISLLHVFAQFIDAVAIQFLAVLIVFSLMVIASRVIFEKYENRLNVLVVQAYKNFAAGRAKLPDSHVLSSGNARYFSIRKSH